MCNHDDDIKEIQKDVKTILKICGEVVIHRYLLLILIGGLVTIAYTAFASV